jgi:transposase
MESRHAHRALSMRLNKTDENDARGLADLMRVSWFKSVHSRTLVSQYTRSMLLADRRLFDTKRQFENQLRNIMKVFGCILGTTAGRGFMRRVEVACSNDPVVQGDHQNSAR